MFMDNPFKPKSFLMIDPHITSTANDILVLQTLYMTDHLQYLLETELVHNELSQHLTQKGEFVPAFALDQTPAKQH